MVAEITNGALDILVDFYLFNAGITFDVKNAIARQEIVIEFLCAADIQDGISRFV